MVDVSSWTWSDLVNTIQVQTRWWRRAGEGRPDAVAALVGPADAVAAALAEGLHAVDAAPDAPCDGLSPTDLVEVRAAALVEALGGRRGPEPADPALRAAVVATVGRLVPAWRAGGRAAVAAHPPRSPVGTVVQVAANGGGVPKVARPRASIGPSGVLGDVQAERSDHGRAWQALSLWSRERIDALAAEGHPIAPGSCGENITVAGIDWDEVRPGVRLHLGPDVVAEVSGEATPCRTIAGSFRDGRFDRIAHDAHPGWSRVYAWVEAGGELRPGDAVRLG